MQRLARIDSDLLYEPDPSVHVGDLELRVARDPEGALAQAELARAYFSLGIMRHDSYLIDLAEARAKSSLALVPFRNTTAIEVLARIASHKHDFERAILLSKQLLDLGDTEGFEVLISALLAQGRVAEARVSAVEFSRVAPGFSSSLQMGLVEEANADLVAAEHHYVAALEADPHSSLNASLWSRSILARYYIRCGRLSDASILLDRVLELSPEYAFALGLEGDLLLVRGNHFAAAEHFQRAFITSRDPMYLYQAAIAYRRGGDERSWRESLDVIISLHQKGGEGVVVGHQDVFEKARRERHRAD